MHYLIDAHNLIGKMPDISLDDPDDEAKLVLRLRGWAARGRRRKVTVIFDHGLPGGVEKNLSTGQVKVLFAPAGRTADALLISRIRKARNPGEYTLVSSDLRVIRVAEKKRMPAIRSEAFVEFIYSEKVAGARANSETETDDRPVSAEDVDMWLKIFGSGSNEQN